MADGVTLIPDISQNTGISSGFADISLGSGISGNTPGGSTGNRMLTEAGDFMVTEAGDRMLLES